MRKTIRVLIITFLIALTLRAQPAHAVTCVTPESQLPRLDTVIDGRIQEITAERARLGVTTYYKGAGGTSLEAEIAGLGISGGRMDWTRAPRPGDRVLIGFVRQDQTLRNEICHLLVILRPNEALPADLGALLGPGQPTGYQARDPRPLVIALITGVLAIAGGLTPLYLRRKRK